MYRPSSIATNQNVYSVDIVSQVYMNGDSVKVSRNAQSSDLAINAQNLYVNCKNLLRGTKSLVVVVGGGGTKSL